MVSGENWNGNVRRAPPNHAQRPDYTDGTLYFFTAGEPKADGESGAEFQTKCQHWVNFSAFLARCTAAGFYGGYLDRLKEPAVDVKLGFDKPAPESTVLRESRLLVAALWILHAGAVFYKDMVEIDKPEWNVKKWVIWEEKLREVASDEGLREEVKRVAGQALEKNGCHFVGVGALDR